MAVLGFGARAEMADYNVKFEVFEGPLDLLLYLIKKEEVDIYEVNLTKLATQFIEYIEVMRLLDLDIAGEFLVMASTLMYIKSRELLPRNQQVQPEEEEEEDPRWELIRQLVEYKKFKDAAGKLQLREIEQESIFPRMPGKVDLQVAGPKSEVSLFDLINAVNEVLKRISKREELREIFEEKWTVSQKIELLLRLVAENPVVKFTELFAAATSRYEVVCTFLAMLELTRLKQITCMQPEPFGEIFIVKTEALKDGSAQLTFLEGLDREKPQLASPPETPVAPPAQAESTGETPPEPPGEPPILDSQAAN
jgi:segregation and condensation protein A